MKTLSLTTALLLGSPLVAAHFKIINATGDMGGNVSALGVLAGDNSQNDVTKFKRKDDKTAGNLFGTLISGGQIELTKSLSTLLQKNSTMELPQVSQGGTLSMFIRQLNGDGAGPVNCTVSLDATGTGVFTNTTMIKDVPGKNGISGENNANFPLVVKMPNSPCTGTVGGLSSVCVVQCQNEIQFGGNVVVQMVGGAGNSSAQAATQANLARRNPSRVGMRAPEPNPPHPEGEHKREFKLAEEAERNGVVNEEAAPPFITSAPAAPLVERYMLGPGPNSANVGGKIPKRAILTGPCGQARRNGDTTDEALPATVTVPPQVILAEFGAERLTMLTVKVPNAGGQLRAKPTPTPTVPIIDNGPLELRDLQV